MGMKCEGSGATVESKFCPDCGRPVGAITGTVIAVPPGATPSASSKPERYDCWHCKDLKRPFKDTLVSHIHATRDGDDVLCAECLELMSEGREYFECSTARSVTDSEGGTTTVYCRRRICRVCVDLSRTQREHSRFNHNEPHWKAPYCACDRYCLNSFLCAFNIFDILNHVQLDDESHCFDNSAMVCCGFTTGVLWMPFQLAMNIGTLNFFGFFSTFDQPLTQRFGIPDRSCAERYFCSCCVNALYAREAALRGYVQPTLLYHPSRSQRRAAMPPPQLGVARTPTML